MPVCIAGMHRSGTSMVANVLHECGLYLGAQSDLMPPTADNPRGYFENLRFVDINKGILVHTANDPDYLPPNVEPRDWDELPHIRKLKRKAEKLIAEFAAREPWGWKDPRNCFTVPFWQSLVPDLKVVICLRHPLEVHESMQKRRHTPHTLGILLWRLHNQFILDHTEPAQRLVTRYERYFEQPRNELTRLLRFVSIKVNDETLQRSLCVTNETLRHYRHAANGEDDPTKRLPPEVAELYVRLCAEADA